MKQPPAPAPQPAATPAPLPIGKAPHAPGAPPSEEGLAQPLPSERDESTDATNPVPDPLMEQAYLDLESGQVDTDLRTSPGLDAERRRDILRGED